MKEFKLLLTSDNEELNQKAIDLSKKIKAPLCRTFSGFKEKP